MALGSFGILSIVHAVLGLFIIIELGLTCYLVDDRYARYLWAYYSPSQLSFMVFNSVWSILVFAYIALTPLVLPKLFHPIIALALTSLTSLFWFAGSIALAVLLGGTDCYGEHYCQTTQAAIAFGFFLWAGFTGLAIVEGLAFWKSRGPAAHADTRSKATGYPGA